MHPYVRDIRSLRESPTGRFRDALGLAVGVGALYIAVSAVLLIIWPMDYDNNWFNDAAIGLIFSSPVAAAGVFAQCLAAWSWTPPYRVQVQMILWMLLFVVLTFGELVSRAVRPDFYLDSNPAFLPDMRAFEGYVDGAIAIPIAFFGIVFIGSFIAEILDRRERARTFAVPVSPDPLEIQ